jgi:predicted metal-dependent enzyme (double-stranded beta helix superfamily)
MANRNTSYRMSRRAMLGISAAYGALYAARGLAVPNLPPSGRTLMRFDRDSFVEDCVAASRENDPQRAVQEVLERAVENSAGVLAQLGAPQRAGIEPLHRSKTLTIFTAHWAPRMSLPSHDHRMWALIGLYTGREDNIYWRRKPGGLEAYRANVLFAGDVAALPADAIHSVTNPLPRFTGAIHIYGGDFFHTPRSQWNPETLAEEPSDGTTIQRIFERENQRLAQSPCSSG